MRNAHPKFMCFPSVVCVGKEVEIFIAPRDINRYFREDKTYKLAILGLGEDMTTYFDPIPFDYPCYVKNGCLCFRYFFDMEQEYSIRFCDESKQEVRLSLYAVQEDLYGLRPLKGDFHSHSFYSDGKDGAAMTPADYREEGFDFFSLTDHNRMYPSDMIQKLYADVPLGIHMIPGEEVHAPGTLVHIVHVGGTNSVAHKYIHEREAYEDAVDRIAETLTHIPEQYRRRMAMCVWACQEIHKAGGLAILAHPCWIPRRYNISREFVDYLFRENIFDAYEVIGGMFDGGNNMQVALWIEQMRAGISIPVVGASDSHNHDYATDPYFSKRFSIVFARENTTDAIMEAVKNGYAVAAELAPNSDTSICFYSDQMRLVQFCHFLYKNYFNETWRLCLGEGILMRRYAEGEDVAAVLSALKDTVENFYKKFYGITPYRGLSPARHEYAETCLQIHREIGPVTKGSSLNLKPGNQNLRQE